MVWAGGSGDSSAPDKAAPVEADTATIVAPEMTN